LSEKGRAETAIGSGENFNSYSFQIAVGYNSVSCRFYSG